MAGLEGRPEGTEGVERGRGWIWTGERGFFELVVRMVTKKFNKETEMTVPFGPPLDFGYKEIKDMADLLDEEADSGRVKDPGSQVDDPSALFSVNSVAIRLNNNALTAAGMSGFEDAVGQLLDDPARLAWLDLSFNKLDTIPEEIFAFTELTTLYLHGNAISRPREFAKLARLPKLRNITLHGNPIEKLPNYRLRVMCRVPTALKLDFTRITRVDRDTANNYAIEQEQARNKL